MRTLDLFAGIGGFSLAARWMGWETAAFIEWDASCQKVLAKNFPGVPIFGNIKDFYYDQEREKIRPIDLICGGFPCQSFSTAGKRNGTSDDRYLWPEMLRVIREVKPRWVVGENVAGLLSMDGGAVFEEICASLEAEGYQVEAFVLPAISRGAPHRRDRVWITAYAPQFTDRGRPSKISSENGRQERNNIPELSITDSVHGFTADASGSGTGIQNRESESGGKRGESSRNSQPQMVRPRDREVNAEGLEPCDRDTPNHPSPRPQERGQSEVGELQEEERKGAHNRPKFEDSQSRLVGVLNKPRLEGHGGYDERAGERIIGATDSEFSNITNPESQQAQPSIEGGLQPEFGGTDRGDQWREHWYEAATRLCRIHDGVSGELDADRRVSGTAEVPKKKNKSGRTQRLKALGNAIVPQVVYEIFRAIQIIEDESP